MKSLYFFKFFATILQRADARTFTVTNRCSYTIWPAIFTGPSANKSTPDYSTGWEAQPDASVSFTVPNDWTAGRIWGRTDCNFNNDSASGQTCLTAWCIGGLKCNPTTGTGVPPATVAEWTLNGDDSQDYYDVSLVDGFNLPMQITNNVGCSVAGCTADLNSVCPSVLKGPTNSSGDTLGCQSACDANLSGDTTDSPNCCSGSYSTAATCPPSGVEYYSFFKGNCPDAYAYAYDESSGTALWKCDSSLSADYTLTFCPSGAVAVSSSGTVSYSASATPSATGNPASSAAISVPSSLGTTSSETSQNAESGTRSSLPGLSLRGYSSLVLWFILLGAPAWAWALEDILWL